MFPFLFFLLRTVTSRRSRSAAWPPRAAPAAAGPAALTRRSPRPGAGPRSQHAAADPSGSGAAGGSWPQSTRVLPRDDRSGHPGLPPDGQAGGPGQPAGGPRPPRRWPVSPKIAWTAVAVAVVLVFRRALAALLLAALSATLHLVGLNVHLPSVRFAWPWQSPGHTATANIDLGPWVLQKIQGISRPALGQVNFTFVFTHRVSKDIGPWPCWYASTFFAAGRASATVALNPGPAWWKPGTGHYRLQVLSRPHDGRPGRVAVTMMLPAPQLPQSVHDVSIDNIQSRPVATQHSWTYPGFGCGLVLRPQFSPSVLYGQAQQVAFSRASHLPRVTRPLIAAAKSEAAQTIRGSFIQPTVNALGYRLASFALRWVPAR
ncbi:MAG TPA: hypothetical protein VFV41_01495 [Streptosporangiaceae bacterium]|nr:hypothetical protein [Streptosporangiaceae bacterium]